MYLIKTIKGDITKVTDVQTIVNAANNSHVKIPNGLVWMLKK